MFHCILVLLLHSRSLVTATCFAFALPIRMYLYVSARFICFSFEHLLPRRRHPLSTISFYAGPGRRADSVGSATPPPSTPARSERDSTNIDRTHVIAAHVNINSITSRCRLDELSQFVSLNLIDVLCLSETKLDDHVNTSLFTIDDFHDPLTRHRNRHGGGVAIYVRNNIPVKRLPNLELSDIEWIWCLVKIKSFTVIISVVYLPPNLSSAQHANFFEKLQESSALALAMAPDNIIIMGDFNGGNTFLSSEFPLHSPISQYETRLKDEMSVLNFTQLINQPTCFHQSTNTTNLRDLIFVYKQSMIQESGVLPLFSYIDHLPIFASLKIDKPSSIPKRRPQLWDYRRTDIDKLIQQLTDTDWNRLLDCDVDEATTNFTETLITAAKSSIPCRTTFSKPNDKPWFTSELRREIRKRDRLFHTAKRRNTEHDWERWRRQRNVTTDTNRRLKSQYIQTQVTRLIDSKKDPRTYHHILKTVIGKKRI